MRDLYRLWSRYHQQEGHVLPAMLFAAQKSYKFMRDLCMSSMAQTSRVQWYARGKHTGSNPKGGNSGIGDKAIACDPRSKLWHGPP